MKIKYSIVLVTVIALFLFSFFVLSQAPINGNIVNGKAKYEQYCLACHGSKGLGDGIAANSLDNKPANLQDKVNSLFKTTDKLANRVLLGKVDKGMPAFRDSIVKQDAIDIFAYIKSIQ